MRKLLVISLVAACACGGSQSQSFPDQARDALPSSSSVHMGNPGDASSSTSASGQLQQDLGAGSSAWYGATVAFVGSVNGATLWTLGAVELVTSLPPASCTDGSCTWGPGSGALDPNSYQLTVSKNADGESFDWHLDAQSKARPGSAFLTIISGNAVPSGIRHRGSGTLKIDLDAASTLNGSTDRGTIDIEYSNVGPAHITASFHDVKDSNPDNAGQLGNAFYDFREQVSGGGDMEIAWHNLTSGDRIDIHSRWLLNGSGRADVAVVKTTGNGSLSNCWATAAAGFATTFDSIGQVGSESACSISPALPGTHINDPQ
jgi:hypothetical protein